MGISVACAPTVWYFELLKSAFKYPPCARKCNTSWRKNGNNACIDVCVLYPSWTRGERVSLHVFFVPLLKVLWWISVQLRRCLFAIFFFFFIFFFRGLAIASGANCPQREIRRGMRTLLERERREHEEYGNDFFEYLSFPSSLLLFFFYFLFIFVRRPDVGWFFFVRLMWDQISMLFFLRFGTSRLLNYVMNQWKIKDIFY